MGKRELVLIAVFVVLGFCVYQITAPAPLPGSDEVSFSGIFNKMKRGIQGSRETGSADSQQTIPVEAAVRELRINIPRSSDITITGEERGDLAAEMHTAARGFDQAEAKASANATKLKIERVGDALVASLDTTAAKGLPRNGGVNQIIIVLKIPRRLALRMDPHPGRLVAGNLASAEMIGARGETRVKGVSGRLVLTHTGGPIEIEDVASLKLNARNSRGTVKKISGPFALDSIGGELRLSEITGPLEVEGRNTDIRIDEIKALKAPLRVNTTGGDVRITGLRTEARIDGRNTIYNVTLAAPAPVTIYNLGEIRVTAPPGGYTLDAVATEGRVTSEDSSITATPGDSADARATAPIRGGGPTLTLRATRGSITVRKPEGK